MDSLLSHLVKRTPFIKKYGFYIKFHTDLKSQLTYLCQINQFTNDTINLPVVYTHVQHLFST